MVDLHVWSIGPNIFSTAIVVLSDQPQVLVPIKEALKDIPEIVHSTVEVHPTLQRDSEPGRLLETISTDPFLIPCIDLEAKPSIHSIDHATF